MQEKRKDTGSAKSRAMSRRQLFTAWRGAWEDEVEDQDAPRQKEAEEKRRELEEQLQQARAARLQGEHARAVELYRPLVRANPRDVAMRRELGLCLYHLQQYIQARVEFERLSRCPEPDALASLYLGLCFLQLDKPAKAVEAWRRFVAESEEQQPLAELLAQQCDLLFESSPRIAQALETVSRAVEMPVA